MDVNLLWMEAEEKGTVEAYQELADLIDRGGLFSPNETIEDVSTGTLRFFLTYWHLYLARQRQRGGDRLAQLTAQQETIGSFERLLNSYGLGLKRLPEDAMRRREVRIAMHREKQEMRQFIAQTEKASEEEMLRQHWLTRIRLAAMEACEEAEMLQAEISLLSKRQNDEEGTGQARSPPTTAPTATKVTRPFVLVSDRQRLQQQVFRPDYNLPTMTIDEYLEIERQRGGILDKATNAEEVDEEAMGERQDAEAVAWQEAKLRRQREFDDFKDAHARGSGNTYRRS